MHVQKIKNIFHLFEAVIANIYFGFPSKKITVIGVTGTDGKTTTTHLLYHILKMSRKKVSMISSIYADVGGTIYDTGLHTTTPRAFTIQEMIKKAVDHGDKYFVLETTSHAIDQNRIWGIEYTISVLTNVTHEHLYHHRTFDAYLKLKTMLLLLSKKSIINNDDTASGRVKQILEDECKQYVTYGLKNDADYSWSNDIKTKLIGDYNKQNILASYACSRELGVDHDVVIKAISSFSLPKGRFDMVYDGDFSVVIDFAHTPNSIFHVLQTVKDDVLENKKGRIIHIFGAAAERDNSKRPKMGENSGQFADVVILTEEDYRHEDLIKICMEIVEGLYKMGFRKVSVDEIKKNTTNKLFTIVSNREEAIRLGISLAKKGDVVIATGKSHEKSLNRGGREYPWDEYEAVRKSLQSKPTPRVGLDK